MSTTRIKPRLITIISSFNKQKTENSPCHFVNLSTGYTPCDASIPVSRAPFQQFQKLWTISVNVLAQSIISFNFLCRWKKYTTLRHEPRGKTRVINFLRNFLWVTIGLAYRFPFTRFISERKCSKKYRVCAELIVNVNTVWCGSLQNETTFLHFDFKQNYKFLKEKHSEWGRHIILNLCTLLRKSHSNSEGKCD